MGLVSERQARRVAASTGDRHDDLRHSVGGEDGEADSSGDGDDVAVCDGVGVGESVGESEGESVGVGVPVDDAGADGVGLSGVGATGTDGGVGTRRAVATGALCPRCGTSGVAVPARGRTTGDTATGGRLVSGSTCSPAGFGWAVGTARAGVAAPFFKRRVNPVNAAAYVPTAATAVANASARTRSGRRRVDGPDPRRRERRRVRS